MAISLARPSRLRLRRPSAEALVWLLTVTLLITGSLTPDPNPDMLRNVGWGILKILPVLAIASLLAGALTLGNWADRALSLLKGGTLRSIFIASLIGAITPYAASASCPSSPPSCVVASPWPPSWPSGSPLPSPTPA